MSDDFDDEELEGLEGLSAQPPGTVRADSQPGHHICGRLPSVSGARLHTCTW